MESTTLPIAAAVWLHSRSWFCLSTTYDVAVGDGHLGTAWPVSSPRFSRLVLFTLEMFNVKLSGNL